MMIAIAIGGPIRHQAMLAASAFGSDTDPLASPAMLNCPVKRELSLRAIVMCVLIQLNSGVESTDPDFAKFVDVD